MLNVYRAHDQQSIVLNGSIARDPWTRLVGLIGRKAFHGPDGMWFPKCNSIHMWMMRFPIDVIFLKDLKTEGTKTFRIEKMFRALPAWKALPVGCLTATDTLELPVGSIDQYQLKSGEVLCIAS